MAKSAYCAFAENDCGLPLGGLDALAVSDDVIVISPTSIRSGLFPLYTTPLHKTSSYNTSSRNTSSRNTCPACNIVEVGSFQHETLHTRERR
jgi:hypothetical protein